MERNKCDHHFGAESVCLAHLSFRLMAMWLVVKFNPSYTDKHKTHQRFSLHLLDCFRGKIKLNISLITFMQGLLQQEHVEVRRCHLKVNEWTEFSRPIPRKGLAPSCTAQKSIQVANLKISLLNDHIRQCEPFISINSLSVLYFTKRSLHLQYKWHFFFLQDRSHFLLL